MRRAALVLGKDPKMLGVPFAAEWMRQRGHSIKSTLNAVVGTVKMMEVQQVGPGSKLQHLGISMVVGRQEAAPTNMMEVQLVHLWHQAAAGAIVASGCSRCGCGPVKL